MILLHGTKYVAIPEEEDDIIEANVELVTLRAAAILADTISDTRGLAWKRDAEALAARLALPYPTNTRILVSH